MRRYLENQTSTDWTAEAVAKLIALRKYEKVIDPVSGAVLSFPIDLKRREEIRAQYRKPENTSDIRMSPALLIGNLGCALQNEAFEVAWPWLSMHMQS